MLWAVRAVLCLFPFLAGAAVFSFGGVLAWRLPRGAPVVRGRSACPACGHTLGAGDLVPVFSWLFLRGRCRYCGARIPLRHLLEELLGGAAALLCGARFGTGPLLGFSLPALTALLACAVLYAIACHDAATQEIPDELNAALGALALAFVLAQGALHGGWAALAARHIAGALCVSVPMLLLCLAVPGGFGGGDIKLMAAAGLLLGWSQAFVAAFLAVLSGGAYAAYLLARGRAGRRDHIAFGPFLCAGIAAALFAGDAAAAWYFALL